MTDHLAKTLAFWFAFALSESFTAFLLFALPVLLSKSIPVEQLLLWFVILTVFNLIFSYKASRVVGWG